MAPTAVRRPSVSVLVAVLAALATSPAVAADVTRPASVTGLTVARGGGDVSLAWDAVGADATGRPESVAEYRVYRGTTPEFVPDKTGGSNRVGSVAGLTFTDAGAGSPPSSYFYLVTAVDAAGNESNANVPLVLAPPVLSGSWTNTTIELSWTVAQPAAAVARYRVYYGKSPGAYEFVRDAGSSTSTSFSGLELYVNWYFAVVAVDVNGNESAYSNQHVDAVAGRVRVRAHDDDYLCWGAANCPPRPGRVQRADGWQLAVPTSFPEGEWKRVLVTYTMDSRLCQNGQSGTTDKCGPNNPGGYNPCGDPWDRIANLFLVLDDCIESGGSCLTPNNLELMRAITPFGTDAPPPLGSGAVPPRRLTLDVTPFAPLLTGTRYVVAEIGHFVQAGWHVTVDFEFSERPDEASPKPPAKGIQVVNFGGTPLPAKRVTVPSDATQVFVRLFTTGHGGTNACDGGSRNGQPCTASGECPGGSCQPCDEFCHRTNELRRNGTVIFSTVPWRSDCTFNQQGQLCTAWNACGFPSCTFARAGWCPGYIACHQNPPCSQDLDLTAQLPPGGSYDLDYRVLLQNSGFQVSLVLYWY